MTFFRGGIFCSIRCLTVAGFLLLLLVETACAASYSIIAHKGVPDDAFSKSEVQAIFLGEKVKWSNRKHIVIAVLDEGTVYREFLQQVVGRTPSQFDSHWQKLLFTGRGILPQSFKEAAQVVEYVANKPGAIGFVPSGSAVTTVKTIAIK